jgi:L-amino acid N-acyltransferase YncA
LHGTATFETEPPDVAEMTARQKNIHAAGLPWFVATENGEVLVIVTFHFTVKDAHTDSLWKIPYT